MKEIWLAVIPATIPTLAVLVSILLNQNGLNKLELRLDGESTPWRAKLSPYRSSFTTILSC